MFVHYCLSYRPVIWALFSELFVFVTMSPGQLPLGPFVSLCHACYTRLHTIQHNSMMIGTTIEMTVSQVCFEIFT